MIFFSSLSFSLWSRFLSNVKFWLTFSTLFTVFWTEAILSSRRSLSCSRASQLSLKVTFLRFNSDTSRAKRSHSPRKASVSKSFSGVVSRLLCSTMVIILFLCSSSWLWCKSEIWSWSACNSRLILSFSSFSSELDASSSEFSSCCFWFSYCNCLLSSKTLSRSDLAAVKSFLVTYSSLCNASVSFCKRSTS